MKKRTAFIGAILSLISIGQPLLLKPLLLKTGFALLSSGLILTISQQALANTFPDEYFELVEIFRKGNFKDAISKFNKLLEKYPNLDKDWNSLIHSYISMSYQNLGKYYLALEYANKAINFGTLNPNLYIGRALVKLHLRDKDGYCSDFGVAYELESDFAGELLEKYACN